jgi:hypothetical protein
MKRSLLLGGGLALLVASLAPACGGSNSGSGFGEQPDSSTSGGGSGGGSGGSSGGTSGGSSGSSSGIIGSFPDASYAPETGLGDAGCATATAKATRSPVYLLFVLDGSGSMSQDNKWTAATTALKAIFSDIQSKADMGLGVGLIVFSDSQDSTFGSGPYPETGVDIPIAYVSSTQDTSLSNRLSGMPQAGTPTQAALTGGYGELEAFMAQSPLNPGGQKVLVLITDGVPTDGCAPSGTNYSSNLCVVQAAGELTKAAPAGPILTYVIGTGVFPSTDLTNFDPNFLGNLAQAGGTGPKGCNPNENTVSTDLCYFEVDPTAGNATQTEMAFENAINAIRGQVLSCTFPLDVNTEAGTIDPGKVNVTVNGMTVGQSPSNGWSYNNPTNPTEIIFNGTACTNLKSDPMASVQIVLGCTTMMGTQQ